jgi:two-component system response regulator FixJ
VLNSALSPREIQVLKLIAAGKSNAEIAKQMRLSPNTVNVHRHNTMKKLGVHSILEAARYAFREGLAKP